ncbi:hypothetical protein BJX68DRAFT_260750 [Aspergillus pseudodeflectus]|uniref:Uncharacterized protein n=1 Tax=Aspergillus pseudodeflectus TaxID=176178 RepID=A0ABR4LBP0_9EURO
MLLRELLTFSCAVLFASAAPGVPGNPPLDDFEPSAVTPSNNSRSCSGEYQFYGIGGYTYSEVEFCVEQGQASTDVYLSQYQQEYKWWGLWYAGNQRELTTSVEGELDGKGHFDTGYYKSTARVHRLLHSYRPKILPGTYTFYFHYIQHGPYWGGDALIDEVKNFRVILGD